MFLTIFWNNCYNFARLTLSGTASLGIKLRLQVHFFPSLRSLVPLSPNHYYTSSTATPVVNKLSLFFWVKSKIIIFVSEESKYLLVMGENQSENDLLLQEIWKRSFFVSTAAWEVKTWNSSFHDYWWRIQLKNTLSWCVLGVSNLLNTQQANTWKHKGEGFSPTLSIVD